MESSCARAVTLFIALITLSSLPPCAMAQVSESGFIRNYNAVQHLSGQELLIGRNRLLLDLNASFSAGEIQISNDLQNLYSASADSFEYTLREAYADLYFSRSDLRIGRQILVWGRAEGTFITDILTPVDLSEFLTQDFSDLRKGVTAVRYNRYFGSDFLQLVINPVFNPNEIPKADSRWFPRPVLETSLPTIYRERNSEPGLDDVQLATKYAFRSNLNFDLDLGLLYWHYPSPAYAKELVASGTGPSTLQLEETYTQSFIALYSGTLQLGDNLLLTSESAYYRRRDMDYLPESLRNLDLQNPSPAEQLQIAQIFGQNDDGFLKERPWLISMIGLQFDLSAYTISTQFVNEHIFNYDSTILQEENYYYSTLLIQRNFSRDTWQLRAFGRYNYSGKDFWINPELTYTGIDSFEATLGSQLFGGMEPDRFYGHLSFHNFAPSSFSYLQVSAYF